MIVVRYCLVSVIILGAFSLIGCKKDSGLSETEQQLIALQNDGKNWILGSNRILKDGVDVTDRFLGFKLSIGNKTYTTQNGIIPVWAPSGTWDFQDDNPQLLLRDDGVVINVSLVSGNLTLTFVADAVPFGGRKRSVSGEYQFQLVSE
ncbi:MAG: hypothetical protein R2820_12230 [Cyclobacteriaceae bacterium]|nr:hypothetical protein [Cyclobacteriaceae bacterium]